MAIHSSSLLPSAPFSPARPSLRPNVLAAPASGIVEVFDYGRNIEGLLPLWVGEGDAPTPHFICEAASKSLAEGETFYTYQAGIPPLREAIAAYLTRLYAKSVDPAQIYVTSSGMHALQIAVTMVAGAGDEVIIPTPAWPNFIGALTIAGANPVEVAMSFDPHQGWQLDLAALEAAITLRSRAIVINSPSNPTGWTAREEELAALLSLARKYGLFIIADEIYGQFYYAEGGECISRAPSFRDVMEAEDRIFFVQTFSKNWAMTGWRLGWLEAPAEYGATITNLIQYSSSGTPVFIQRAGIAALEGGDGFIAAQVMQARQNRDALVHALQATNRFRIASPYGAFYLFFGVEGVEDSRALAFKLIDTVRIGLAPGNAFGKAGEGFLRLCYLRKAEDIAEAARRLSASVATL